MPSFNLLHKVKVSSQPGLNKKADSVTPVPMGSAWQLFRIWLAIGAQSFGGGVTTTLLIRREMIHKRGWFTDQDYVNMWTLCTLAPGINLVAFAIIIGRRLAGIPGLFACLLGMLLPSAAITTLLTVGFTSVQNWSPFQAMLKGIIPAVIGLSFLFVIQFAQPIFKQSWKEGKTSLAVNLLLAASCAVLLGLLHLSAVLVVVGSGLVGAVIFPFLLPELTSKSQPSSSEAIDQETKGLNN